ncbi:MAG: hypothetical protein WCP03_03130 [Candidatus Saccharibacteria bacterium]
MEQSIGVIIFITLIVAASLGWWLEERKHDAASASPRLHQLRKELTSTKRELSTIRLRARDGSAQRELEGDVAVLRSKINALEQNLSSEEVTSAAQPSKVVAS